MQNKNKSNLIKESGIEVNELTPEQREKFVEATKSVYSWFEDTYGDEGKELVDIAKSYNK